MLALLLVVMLVCGATAQLLPSYCGVPEIPPSLEGNKIVSNTEAIPHSWSWQVQIRRNGQHWCGGSLITAEWVLTAAQCTINQKSTSLTIHGGRHTKNGTNEPFEQVAVPRAIVNHVNYFSNQTYTVNDIALIRLNKYLRRTKYVSEICVSDPAPTVGTEVWVTGWGDVANTCCPDKLKQAKLHVVSLSSCRDQWKKTFPPTQIADTVVCAGEPSGYPSSCNGDSGGPLVRLKGTNHFTLTGIVSFGINGCTTPGFPAGYTQVADYYKWIISVLNDIKEEEALASRNVRFQPRMGAAFRTLAKSKEDY